MLDGKRIAILAEDGFEDSELIGPMRAMKDAGARVVIVGSGSKGSHEGKRGNTTVKVDVIADKTSANNFDAVIVPGGYAPDKMRLHQPMVVRGRRVTSWPSIAVDLRNAGAEWVDEPVVQDGNLITARKPADLPKFNKAIIEALRVERR